MIGVVETRYAVNAAVTKHAISEEPSNIWSSPANFRYAAIRRVSEPATQQTVSPRRTLSRKCY